MTQQTPIPLDILKGIAPFVLDIVKRKVGNNPLANTLIDVTSRALGQHTDPTAVAVKQELDAGVKDALAALHQAGQDARDSVKFRPPGG